MRRVLEIVSAFLSVFAACAGAYHLGAEVVVSAPVEVSP